MQDNVNQDTSQPPGSDKMMAAIDMIGRMGATDFQLRYHDDEDPVVWIAVSSFTVAGQRAYQCNAAFNPERAVLRLVEAMVDGGMCAHCQRPTGLEPDSLEPMPASEQICWYQYDPELKTFRRGCEGEV